MNATMPDTGSRRRERCDFLKFARSRVTPSAEFTTGGRRCVPGLRRDEVASQCNVSVSWYTWFETGRPNVHASPRLIAAVARTLQLTPIETTYLFTLAIPEMPPMKSPIDHDVRATLQDLKASWPRDPAEAIAALRRTCDLLPVGVYCTSPDGRIGYANRALIALMGYSSKVTYMQLEVGRDLYEREAQRHIWKQRIAKERQLYDVSTTARRADGSQIELLDSAMLLDETNENALSYLGLWLPASIA
jgi:PAS domain S-box-containing protein